MRQLIINLDDKIKTLFVVDNVIIDMHEFVRSVTVLDKLYSMISEHHVNQVIFITHNILSMCMYENVCIAFDEELANGTYLSVMNYDDTKKLVEICHNAGVYNVQFVDTLGYYVECGKKGVAYVDKSNGIYRALSVNGCLSAYSTYVGSSPDEWVSTFVKDNNLSSVVKCEEFLDTDYLMVFLNGALLAENESLLKDLSLFGFSILCDDKYKYDSSVLERDTKAIMAAEDVVMDEPSGDMLDDVEAENKVRPQRSRRNKNPVRTDRHAKAFRVQNSGKSSVRERIPETVPDDLEDKVNSSVKTSLQKNATGKTNSQKNTAVKDTRSSRLSGLLSTVVLGLGLCGIFFTIYLMMFACPKLDAELNKAQMLYDSGSARVSDLQSQIQLYQNCNGLMSIELLPIDEVAKSTMPAGSTLLSVNSDSMSGSSAKIRFLKEENAIKYSEELKSAGYMATMEPITIEVPESEDSQEIENSPSLESRYVVTIYLGKLE